MKVSLAKDLPYAFKNLDLCLIHAVYLEAIREYINRGGKGRGSYLVLDADGEKFCPGLGEEGRFSLAKADDFVNQKILEVRLAEEDQIQKSWVEPSAHTKGGELV